MIWSAKASGSGRVQLLSERQGAGLSPVLTPTPLAAASAAFLALWVPAGTISHPCRRVLMPRRAQVMPIRRLMSSPWLLACTSIGGSQLAGVFGSGRQCAAHGVQVAAKDAVISGKAGCLKAWVLQHGLGWAHQIGMLLGVADAAQLAPSPDRGAAYLLEGANAPPTGPGNGMQGTFIGGSASLFVIVQVGAVDAFGSQLIELIQLIEIKEIKMAAEAAIFVGEWCAIRRSCDPGPVRRGDRISPAPDCLRSGGRPNSRRS